MVEAGVSAFIALVTGGFVLTNRIYGRILELDKRIDSIELRIAQAYVSKADLQLVIERMEGHMERIENKLDTLVNIGRTHHV